MKSFKMPELESASLQLLAKAIRAGMPEDQAHFTVEYGEVINLAIEIECWLEKQQPAQVDEEWLK